MKLSRSPLIAALALAGACKSAPQVDVALTDPCGLKADAVCDPKTPDDPDGTCGKDWCARAATYVDFAIYPDGCPSDDALLAGDVSTALSHQVVGVGQDLAAPGDLAQSTFGFAVYLRGDDCHVVGGGCTVADLSRVRTVSIRVDPFDGTTTCAKGSACVAGVCTEGGGSTDGGVTDAPADASDGGAHDGATDAGGDASGGACSLAVVASGKLPAASAAGATEIGPAITATSSGFLLAWREVDATAMTSRLTAVPLAADGTVGAAQSQAVSQCPSTTPAGGLGLAYAPAQNVALAVTAQPSCMDGGAGASFLALNADGTPSTSLDFTGAGPDLSLAAAHAVTTDATGATFELAYVSSQAAYRLPVVASGSISLSPFTAILPGATSSFGQVSSSSDLLATLADRAADGGTQTVLGLSPWDGGAGVQAVLDAGAPASLAAWKGRAIAVARASGGATWDLRSAAGASLGAGKLGTATYASLDVAVLGDHAVIAGGSAAAITLFRIDGANGKPVLAPAPISLGPTVGKVSLAGYDGAHVALAAAGDRVAITWATARTAIGTNPVGGWALLACSP